MPDLFPVVTVTTSILHAQEKPVVISYDCGYECSLDHWLQVYWLVEKEDLLANNSIENAA